MRAAVQVSEQYVRDAPIYAKRWASVEIDRSGTCRAEDRGYPSYVNWELDTRSSRVFSCVRNSFC
jgi:hypothetical protein